MGSKLGQLIDRDPKSWLVGSVGSVGNPIYGMTICLQLADIDQAAAVTVAYNRVSEL